MKLKKLSKGIALLTVTALLGTALVGCGGGQQGGQSAAQKLSGTVLIDGSSTVFPITEAVAEEFKTAQPDVKVTVGVSGTGGGFKKFANNEIDIADASRPIKAEEKDAVQKNNIEYIEIPVGYDALSVVVNKDNNFVDYLTKDELKKIWAPDSKVKTWKDVRDSFPAEPIKLYGPGTDSGTFDYFTEAINGKAGDSRKDFTASEDDNILVQGIAGDKNSLGYFGFAYLEANLNKIKAVPVVNKEGEKVAPSKETVLNGKYNPLSRTVFIYVKKSSLAKPEVKAFVEYYLKNAEKLVDQVKYVPLPADKYTEGLNKLK